MDAQTNGLPHKVILHNDRQDPIMSNIPQASTMATRYNMLKQKQRMNMSNHRSII